MADPARPVTDFETLYRQDDPPPWDTEAPKENVVAWHEAGLIHGRVLDIGCGLGDNAVFLARQGHHVTGLDISPTALVTARRRAADAGADVGFGVADATRLDGYTADFDTVVDSGMYHCLGDADKRSYAAAVRRAARPGATLLLSAFSDANARTQDWNRPMVSEHTLRETLGGAGWHITSLSSNTIVRPHAGTEAELWLLVAQRGD
jgi:cyclopropane fatty-acyl-phospholipid synthase-like methyltransferase